MLLRHVNFFCWCKYGNATLVPSAIHLYCRVSFEKEFKTSCTKNNPKKTLQILKGKEKKKELLKMNSVILKHKVRSGISAPLPFPAYFIRNFTAIFYAHGLTINMEVSSMESCSLLLFLIMIFCVRYLETNTRNRSQIAWF